jgi:hypothetical protein
MTTAVHVTSQRFTVVPRRIIDFSLPVGRLFNAARLVVAGDGETGTPPEFAADGRRWFCTAVFSQAEFGLEGITSLQHLKLRLGVVAPGPPPDNDAASWALLRIV